MDDNSAIDVRGLCKTYRDGFLGRKKIEALRGVDLRVERGEIFALLGPNGAGKTTLIKVLLGIVRRNSGEARLLGRSAGNRASKRKVGYLPEHHRIPHHLTGDTALEYYGGLSGMPMSEIKRRRPELLETVGLADWNKTRVKKYSKGMLQRLGLAQAMLHDPELLILDEPTDGVDPVGRSEIRDVLKALKAQGKTVFLNSHLLQEVELICDRVAILHNGTVRRVGKVDELTQMSSVEALFSLEGDEAAIRNALNGYEITHWQAVEGGRFRVSAEIAEQLDLDQAIDRLRAADVSIYAVTRRQLTLEQAFLKLIQDAPLEIVGDD